MSDCDIWFEMAKVPAEDRRDWPENIQQSVKAIEAQMAAEAETQEREKPPAPSNVIAARELLDPVELDFFYIRKLLEKVFARCVDCATAIDGSWTRQRMREVIGPVLKDADIEAEMRSVFRGLALQVLLASDHDHEAETEN